MGEYKKGLYNGKGIEIFYPIREIPADMSEEEIKNTYGERYDREIVIYTGNYKKGVENGEVKQYFEGKLFYDGEMENGEMNGKGTLYYMGTNQKRYEGEWRMSEYHGKGTLYDENGEKIYSGEWKMGDYAS